MIGYIKRNWKNYLLLIFTVILLLLLAEAVLSIFPVLTEEKTIFEENYEFNITLTHNSDGFRDEEFTKYKDKNTGRIFLIGDSFVYGAVKLNRTIDKLLEERLNRNSTKRWEVWNLGIPGAGPAEYYETAKKFRDYNPDIVIVSLYVDNDIIASLQETSSASKFFKSLEITKLYESIAWDLTCEKKLRDDFIVDDFYIGKICDDHINRGLVFRAGVGDNQKYYDFLAELFRQNPYVKEKILAIRDLYPGVPFLLIANPSKYQVSTMYFSEMEKLGFVFENNETVGREIQDEIYKWANSTNITYVRILNFMKENETAPYFYAVDDHYTKYANILVADRIYTKMKKKNLLE